MNGDIDNRLVGLLRASLRFSDALRDVGAKGGIAVSLDRDDGLALLKLLAGHDGPEAEALSQRGRRSPAGFSTLEAGGITFTWPCPLPAAASNDNGKAGAGRFGFEEDTPALR